MTYNSTVNTFNDFLHPLVDKGEILDPQLRGPIRSVNTIVCIHVFTFIKQLQITYQ